LGKTIDSGALSILNRILGLAGSGGSQRTELEDGLVTQVLDVASIVRRSRAASGSEGIFYGLLQNTHAVANSQSSTIDPYAPGTLQWNTYPASIPDGFDVWVLGCSSFSTLTGSNFSEGILELISSERHLGWAVDQAGAAIGGAIALSTVLARWDIAGSFNINLTHEEQSFVKAGIRVRRGQTISFSSTSSGALTTRVAVILGVFPSALGQDAST